MGQEFMKILIIRGRDAHTYGRIVPGFVNCNNEVKVVESYDELDGSYQDMILIDPSVKFDPSSKVCSKFLMFYDCEDGSRDFFPDIAYFSMKDKIKYYAKMNYVDDDRKDGIKNIAFPLPIYNQLSEIAKHDFTEFEEKHSKCFLLGHGTFLGHYVFPGGHFNCEKDISPIATINDTNSVELLYNQRIDWILSMKRDGVPYVGGIVFQNSDNNLSYNFQKKLFGNIDKVKADGLDWFSTFNEHSNNKIGLCPTGHERISWRTFDLMAAGSVIFLTDTKNQKCLIMPEEYITVHDGINFSDVYFKYRKDFKEIWKASQKNKIRIANLTPEKIMSEFFNQL